MNKILIVESVCCPHIATQMFQSVKKILDVNGIDFEKVNVHNIFDISIAMSIALDAFDYDGVIVIGAISSGDNSVSKIIFKESIRSMLDLATHFCLPFGNSVLYFKNTPDDDQLTDHAKGAAEACLKLIKIKNLYQISNSDYSSEYKN